ncbi:hypothetical protein HMPREF1210_00513 [Paenisporosarcina sp. HGH0030]|uniref:hypothetical protein n=1 Tax=Paenisporosarcina sp. HGH0030 TaxID=1078085 RepID=UPI00034E4183|nr:hypothetical protein [Paenisporosarcina sp. HGH0030]EPD53690.1 hypothetical protein HMPREF1210_00513 [Paenisporosarcina sp. HGH0030]
MNKDKIKGFYYLWVLVLFFELAWLYIVNYSTDSADDLIFVVTVIAATLTVGAVGLKLFGESDD